MPTRQWQKDPYYSRRAKRFPWQTAQPSEVWNDFANAMGIDPGSVIPASCGLVERPAWPTTSIR